MKIIGHTNHGYLCEVSKDEMKLSTGKDEPWSHDSHAHPVGNIVNCINVSKHAKNMKYTIEQRKKAAEQLRAVATIIEQVPETFTAPEEIEALNGAEPHSA
jgi:hypothetical protein